MGNPNSAINHKAKLKHWTVWLNGNVIKKIIYANDLVMHAEGTIVPAIEDYIIAKFNTEVAPGHPIEKTAIAGIATMPEKN